VNIGGKEDGIHNNLNYLKPLGQSIPQREASVGLCHTQ
jgi:hypothetical protein